MKMLMRVKTFACAALLGVLTLSTGSAFADAVRVGSYNILTCRKFAHDEIRGWEARKESVVELLKKIDADVIGLQEVHDTQLEFLRTRLPEYGFVGERVHPTKKVSCRVPVVYRLSRFECEESKEGLALTIQALTIQSRRFCADPLIRRLRQARYR